MKKFLIILLLILSFFPLYGQSYTAVSDYAHFASGFIISSTSYSTIYMLSQNEWLSIGISSGLSILCGIGKEIYDLKIKQTKFDLNDLVLTNLGAISGIIIFKININNKKIKNNKKEIN